MCEAAIEKLLASQDGSMTWVVIITSQEFNLVFSVLKLHAKNEIIQKYGLKLLFAGLECSERALASGSYPVLGQEQLTLFLTQLATVVCNILANFTTSYRTLFGIFLGMKKLEKSNYMNKLRLRAYHATLLKANFLSLAMPLLEHYAESDYHSSIILIVLDAIVEEGSDKMIVEAVKSNANNYTVLVGTMDNIILERNVRKLKFLKMKLIRMLNDDDSEEEQNSVQDPFFDVNHVY